MMKSSLCLTHRDYSLKSATRDKRRQGRAPIHYQVRDDTNIKHIPMNRFLSHEKTKADLTNYLAAKILEYNTTAQKMVITSSSGHTSSNDDLHFQDNNQLDPLKNGYHKDSDAAMRSVVPLFLNKRRCDDDDDDGQLKPT